MEFRNEKVVLYDDQSLKDEGLFFIWRLILNFD